MLTISLGGGGRGVPLLAAGEVGLSPMGIALRPNTPGGQAVAAVAGWMRGHDDGAYIALCDRPDAGRRFMLVQDNRGAGAQPNFYQRRNSNKHVAWRDFYYATVSTLVLEADQAWGEPTIEIAHPTGHGWPDGLLPTMLEALRHLADRHSLSLRHIALNECCLNNAEAQLAEAMSILHSEQTASAAPARRSVVYARVSVGELGLSDLEGIAVWKIDLPA